MVDVGILNDRLGRNNRRLAREKIKSGVCGDGNTRLMGPRSVSQIRVQALIMQHGSDLETPQGYATAVKDSSKT